MATVKSVVKKFVRRFTPSAATAPPEKPPWFDRPDALSVLDRRRRARGYSDREFESLQKWVRDGYFVVEGLVSPEAIDEMNGDVDEIWHTSVPRPGLKVHGLALEKEDAPGDVPHEKLLEVPLEPRMRLMREQGWRIHWIVEQSAPARKVFESAALERWLHLIYDRAVPPNHSITFMFGSEQKLHQDMAVFPIDPKNWLVGVWIACENVSPDAGPLIYCPGSHAVPTFPGFTDYPWTFLRTCSKDLWPAYQSYVDQAAEKYPKHTFLGKKGDVLFWHGNLIHGGAPVKDRALSRKSFVLHASPEGCDKTIELLERKVPLNY